MRLCRLIHQAVKVGASLAGGEDGGDHGVLLGGCRTFHSQYQFAQKFSRFGVLQATEDMLSSKRNTQRLRDASARVKSDSLLGSKNPTLLSTMRQMRFGFFITRGKRQDPKTPRPLPAPWIQRAIRSLHSKKLLSKIGFDAPNFSTQSDAIVFAYFLQRLDNQFSKTGMIKGWRR